MQGNLDSNWDARKKLIKHSTAVEVSLFKDEGGEATITIRLNDPFKKDFGEDDDLNITMNLDEFMFYLSKQISSELITNGG